MKSDLEIVDFRLKLLMKLTDFITKNQMRGKIDVVLGSKTEKDPIPDVAISYDKKTTYEEYVAICNMAKETAGFDEEIKTYEAWQQSNSNIIEDLITIELFSSRDVEDTKSVLEWKIEKIKSQFEHTLFPELQFGYVIDVFTQDTYKVNKSGSVRKIKLSSAMLFLKRFILDFVKKQNY